MGVISVRGASEHNLKDVNLEIPKNCLVVVTGVSGSGKSSLVFDTIYAEAFRRFADASGLPTFVLGNAIEVRFARPKVSSIRGIPPALGLSQRQGVAGRFSTVGSICGATDLLRVYFAAFGLVYCRSCAIPLRSTRPSELMDVVFERFGGTLVTVIAPIAERRKGAFADELNEFRRQGFSRLRVNGRLVDLQEEEAADFIDPKKLNTIELLIDKVTVAEDKRKRLERVLGVALGFGKGVVKLEGPVLQEIFNTKSSCPQCGESSPKLDPRHFSHSSLGQCPTCEGTGAEAPELSEDLRPCRSCRGSRLSNKLPMVRVHGRLFADLTRLSIFDLHAFVRENLVPGSSEDRAKGKIIRELDLLLATLVRLGSGHLSLNRAGNSLVPGDLQRLRLAAMIAAPFAGALYVLDEPCQGLTRSEVEKFIDVLRELIAHGASILAVEHHPQFLAMCDVIVTLGPGAGEHGGRVCSVETQEQNQKAVEKSSQKKEIVANVPPASGRLALEFRKVALRGRDIGDVKLLLGGVNLLRGPAGSGKSSFVRECLEPVLAARLAGDATFAIPYAEIIVPEGFSLSHLSVVKPGSLTRTTRRTVAAALDILPLLRAIFATVPQAELMGLTEMHFSWNSKLGRCDACEGRGFIELKQRYGPAVEVQCETCLGAKLSARSLIPRFKGRNVAELMDMSIDEALQLFENFRLLNQRLAPAKEFGLGYVKLGQTMESLSGGEMQRLLLVMELRRVNLVGSWFLLMHPGTGLHAPDIVVLSRLLRTMANKGATFVLIDNREEFLSVADVVVELQASPPK